MFPIDYSAPLPLPEIKYSGALVNFGQGQENYGTLVNVDFGSNVKTAIEAYQPGVDISLPEDWQGISAIASDGQIFIPANDIESPQPGEYIYNPYTNTIKVYGPHQNSLVLYGQLEQVLIAPVPVSEPFPGAFTSIPIQGKFTIGRSIEQHPTASFDFETNLSKSFIQNLFVPGLEIDIYGIPFRINNISIDEQPRSKFPGSRQKVSVSFGSKWENYLGEPIFLRDDGTNNITSNNDPECVAGYQGAVQRNSTTTIQKLLKKVGIPYIGPDLATVPIATDAPRDTVVNLGSLIDERLRVKNSFIRWSNANGVEVVNINALRTWVYSENKILSEVKSSYDAITKTSKRRLILSSINPQQFNLDTFPNIPEVPNYNIISELSTNLGFEYANAELSTNFTSSTSSQNERTQGASTPRYTKKDIQRKDKIDGDKTANIPLKGVKRIQAMSLCNDSGGETKGLTITTTENGTIVKIVDELWGFIFTARDIFDYSKKRLDGDPLNYWQLIKKTTTDYVYDYITGYLLYEIQYGYNTVRFKQESGNLPETLKLPTIHPEFYLYEFFSLPIIGRTSYVLTLIPEYSTDGAYQIVKVCNRDGSSSMKPLYNPDYAPPYYVSYQRQESSSFKSTTNPKSTQKLPLPDIYIGEDSGFEASVEITKAEYQEITIGFEDGYPLVKRGKVITPQTYRKYIKKFKAQGDNIGKSLEDISTEYGEGDPPTHQRRSPQYELENATPPESKKSSGVEPKYRYLLQTEGYFPTDPINGSENFPLAKNIDEAIIAAKCKLTIENGRSGIKENLDIPLNLMMAEGDKFNYYCNGQLRQRLVLNVTHNFNILGEINGVPKVTATTSLGLGRWLSPTLKYTKTLIPNGANSINIVSTVDSDSLGQAIDWLNIRSRRNP